ncbi:Peptidoglycan/xylan/chitin deacetylase, PgdA/CDA1 family [Marininema mesophilum]|uniref:Peptidoglycan/xylan/chitin deacetylase, PgdA/CDA1 family n=1 Tax=Marininema mesophilum TaxID=1048340 RepID=A0A1H2Q019_9BACL|nr:polysaccharide deacetylase family protein [Marininema mesophilum]SDV99859.1 Peptidoglycan/xylan/chitin deacetylase, PgdA/CDA1 family [Marininema mesophilum]
MRGKVQWISMLVTSVLLVVLGTSIYLFAISSKNLDEKPRTKKIDFQQTKHRETEKRQVVPLSLQQKKVEQVLMDYEGRSPTYWGESVPGVKHHLDTKKKVMTLTFDACGGPRGSQVDKRLLQYLENEKIPATLFINSRWIDAHPKRFRQLAANPLFEIANHGTEHRPLSVNGRSVYGIKGTQGIREALNEILSNQRKIASITGKAPRYFRSGTAYYDDVSVAAAQKLGVQIVNFDILGDAGATYNREQVNEALLHARAGSIIILHMNQPESETAEGVRDAVPVLRKKGFRFVKVGDVGAR